MVFRYGGWEYFGFFGFLRGGWFWEFNGGRVGVGRRERSRGGNGK